MLYFFFEVVGFFFRGLRSLHASPTCLAHNFFLLRRLTLELFAFENAVDKFSGSCGGELLLQTHEFL
jgi:hypothetical protein